MLEWESQEGEIEMRIERDRELRLGCAGGEECGGGSASE
jgi:hypothetical protein